MKLTLPAAFVATLLTISNALSTTTTTVPLTFTGLFYTAKMEVGGQSFDLVVDAGSSTLWVPSTDFKCLNPNTEKVWADYNCGFVNLYNATASSTYSPIPDKHLSASYGTGEFLGGPAGLETVTIGGLQFPTQEFMMATLDGWQGENLTNGIWGFAYPALTDVYNGTTANLSDFDGAPALVKSVPEAANFLPKASADGIIAPVVGLALQATQKVGGYGGLLTVGGVPNVSVTSPFVTLPIQKTAFLAGTNNRVSDIIGPPRANDTYEYAYYTIEVDGVSLQAANGLKTFSKNYLAYADSGSPSTTFDLETARAINHAFSPPAIYNASIGEFLTSCDATPPIFSLTLGNQSFISNPAALLSPLEQGSKICVSMVMNSTKYVKTIGAPFLTGVVAVFDQGNNTLSFASTLGGGNGTGSGTSPSGSATQSPVPAVTASMGIRSIGGVGGLFAAATAVWGFNFVL